MPDLIPEGCISLRAAYDSFVLGLWFGHDPVAELHDMITYKECPPQIVGPSKASLDKVTNSLLDEFRNAFATGSLSALVRVAGASENSAVPQDSWGSVYFPERAFLEDQIVHRHGGYWDGLVGRTPFVRQNEFDPWLAAKIERKNYTEAVPSASIQALRTHLIGLAANGLLASGEIEQLASKWGLLPIASRPPEGSCDPMGLSHWTLAMAVSWIAWRDISCVREAMDAYRSDCWEWTSFNRRFLDGDGPYEISGEELGTLGPLSLSHLCGLEAVGSDAWDLPMLMSIKSARETLWRHLGQGDISAAAFDDAGDHVIVPQHQWAALELAASRSGQDYLCFLHDSLRAAYTEIMLPSSGIRTLWPPSLPDETGQPATMMAQPRPIALEIEEQSHRILFADGPVLEGRRCELFMLLAEQFLIDREEGLAKTEYRFTPTRCITTKMSISEQNLRQHVKRIRQSLEKQFVGCVGYSVGGDRILESQNWTGYRLNPDLILKKK